MGSVRPETGRPGFAPRPGHTKDLIKMVPNTSLLGTQHKGLDWGPRLTAWAPELTGLAAAASSIPDPGGLYRVSSPISLPLSCLTTVLSIKAKSNKKKFKKKKKKKKREFCCRHFKSPIEPPLV